MSTQVLPKSRRPESGSSGKVQSGRIGSIQDLSHKGRAISGRSGSATKRLSSNNRHVSRGELFVSRADEANTSFEDNAIHFDENRNTILSNFEEWIKLSTDNKITSKNSWQFALIDYFHDLNVIKDGENINFQRASATLDGCVKIYLSRVESVATETGKLLSGLATKKGVHGNEENDGEEKEGNAEDEEVDASMTDGDDIKKKRRVNRVLESTLVPFETIKIKKLDQELAIDPLFKKALAEFDEGGAKSLLLNTLSIDSDFRVIFDATSNPAPTSINDKKEKETDQNNTDIDLSGLKRFIYDPLPVPFNDQTLCPSMEQLEVVLSDINKAKSVLTDVNNRIQEDSREPQADYDQQNAINNDYDDDMGYEDLGGMDIDIDEDNKSINNLNATDIDKLGDHRESNGNGAKDKVMDIALMSYFDEKMKSNWRGPEHWRIQAIKSSKRFDVQPARKTSNPTDHTQTAASKKKQETIINFLEYDDVDEDELFDAPKSHTTTTLKPDQRTSENRNKLPEDIRYNSVRLTNLFMKPEKPILSFSRRKNLSSTQSKTLTDENYFAKQYSQHPNEEPERLLANVSTSMRQADLEELNDADFGAVDFNDALEGTPEIEDPAKYGTVGSTQLITGGRKVRPEYVNFSRIAKRVDVKLLKANIWKSINEVPSPQVKKDGSVGLDDENNQKTPHEMAAEEKPNLKTFRNVVETVGRMYGTDEKRDLSTSFCFICLLHLANEHSLNISTNENHDDLIITGI